MEASAHHIVNTLNAAAIAADIFMEEDVTIQIVDGGVLCKIEWLGRDGTPRKIDNFTPWTTIEVITDFNPLLASLRGLQEKKKYSGVSG